MSKLPVGIYPESISVLTRRRQLKTDLGLATLKGVPVVGDKLADLDLAAAVGARGLLVLTGKGTDTAMLAPIGTEIYADLAAAADDLLRGNAA